MTDLDSACALCGGENLEPLARGVSVVVGNGHTFNTDTVLLAAFSMPRAGEVCADFGTGCGAIPLIWCARAKPGFVYAVELQPAACSMARRSIELSGMAGRIGVVECDIRRLREERALPAGGLDSIACNPPYKPVGAGVASSAESGRIVRHETACTFAEIVAAASHFLRWGGRFFCCMRPERLCDTLFALRQAGLEPKRLRFVQQRVQAAPFLFLLQAGRGGRPGITVEPSLLVEDADGRLSEEMLAIYGDYKEGHR